MKKKILSPGELLRQDVLRMLETRAALVEIYGEDWGAQFGVISGKGRCTIAAGLDAEVAAYITSMHRLVPKLVTALRAKEADDAV